MKAWIATGSAKNNFYDKSLGKNTKRLLLKHESALKDHYLKEHGLDLRKTLENMDPLTMNEIDDKITARVSGFESGPDYHYKASCCHVISKIKTPTLFMNSLDDPIVIRDCIDFDSIK